MKKRSRQCVPKTVYRKEKLREVLSNTNTNTVKDFNYIYNGEIKTN